MPVMRRLRTLDVANLVVLLAFGVLITACGGREEPAPPAEPQAAEPQALEPPAAEPQAAPYEPSAPAAAPAPAPVAQPTTVDLEIYKAGFIVGASGGKGTLHFQGRRHALSIAGVSVGATAGISKADLVGDVENLHRLSDIEGTYSAPQAGLALGGGEKITRLTNSKGVVLNLRGKQMGIELSIDLNGMQISLAR
jgi:hypothetical protein